MLKGIGTINLSGLYVILVVAFVLLSLLVPLAIAARAEPVAACPEGFQLQTVVHSGDTGQLVGSGSGWFCTKPMPAEALALVHANDGLPRLARGYTIIIIVGT